MNCTEQALQMIARQVEVAKRDGTGGTRRVKITIQKDGKPRYMHAGQRIKEEDAIAIVAQALAEEAAAPEPAKAPSRTNFDFYKLNHHTQLLFWDLCEQIQAVTQDHSNSIAVRLGHDIPKIAPQQQPRLTNLKKAGVLKSYNGDKKSHKMLVLTESGQKIWNSGKA